MAGPRSPAFPEPAGVGPTIPKAPVPEPPLFLFCFPLQSASPFLLSESGSSISVSGGATLRASRNDVQAVRGDNEAMTRNVVECRGSWRETGSKSPVERQNCVRKTTLGRVSARGIYFRPQRFINC